MTEPHLIHADWVVPVLPEDRVHANATVVVSAGRIDAILPADVARGRYPAAGETHLPGHVLIPGLVNTHTHAAMTLMRGLADDLPLMTWLRDHIWPAEARHVSPDFVYDGTLAATVESLRGGVTCLNDMYFFPEQACRAALETGIRFSAGMIVIEFPTRYASDPQDYLTKGLEMRDALRQHPRLSFCLAPHAPYTVSDDTFRRVATLAEQLDVPIHLHVHETAHEIQESRDQHGSRPLARLDALGLLGPRLIGVHAVHLEDSEIAELARFGVTVAHCPSSNLKLASGIARVSDLVSAGVNVALGTDGAASNNRLDLFEEMRLAALLAKGASGKADTVPARTALAMATLNGARALGLADRIGSLEPGKDADIVAVNLSGLSLSPCFDPVSHLVYAASRSDVSHVWVEGELLVEHGQFTRFDGSALSQRLHQWQVMLQAEDKLGAEGVSE